LLFFTPPGETLANDGWMGTTASWSLQQSSPTAILAIRCLAPGEAGPNTLQVHVDGQKVATHAVTPGERDLRCVLVGTVGVRSVTLAWDHSSALPAPDNRHVAARIFRIAIDPIQATPSQWTPDADIVPAGGPVGLGSGWQPLETWQGSTFRWLSGTCQIAVVAGGDRTGTLTLDAQPGTGTKLKPAEVHLIDREGNLVDKVEVDSRMRFDLLIPPKALAAQPLALVVVNGGATTKEDPRSLDLQVFSCSWTPSPIGTDKN
jgi:hypothetical protein